jgi:hypothetical protein
MNSVEIVSAIRVYLGQPVAAQDPPDLAGGPLPEGAGRFDLNRLAMLTEAIKWEASKVGLIPRGYPRRVNLVMEAIHRLLPWYTRPIQTFSRLCADQAQEVAHQISMLEHAQSELLARIRALESQRNSAETSPKSVRAAQTSANTDDARRQVLNALAATDRRL